MCQGYWQGEDESYASKWPWGQDPGGCPRDELILAVTLMTWRTGWRERRWLRMGQGGPEENYLLQLHASLWFTQFSKPDLFLVLSLLGACTAFCRQFLLLPSPTFPPALCFKQGNSFVLQGSRNSLDLGACFQVFANLLIWLPSSLSIWCWYQWQIWLRG